MQGAKDIVEKSSEKNYLSSNHINIYLLNAYYLQGITY